MTDTRVVVIDDDRDTVEVFCEYLSIHDLDIVARGFDGRTAVELYKEHKPDVILIDLHMPDPDNKYFEGLDALKAIRKFDQQSKIIIVIGDELFSAEEEKELVRLKVNAVIYKPYEIDSIVQSIENVLKSETYTSILEIEGVKKTKTDEKMSDSLGFIKSELNLGVSPKQILSAFEAYINAEVERKENKKQTSRCVTDGENPDRREK